MFNVKDLIFVLIAGLATSYITKALLLEEKESHEGPFIDPDKKVVFAYSPEEVHFQRFSLFDRIRNLFGVYERDNDLFYVKDHWKTEMFTCPFCLSQWVSYLSSIPYFLHEGNLFKSFLIHFSISAISSFLNKE